MPPGLWFSMGEYRYTRMREMGICKRCGVKSRVMGMCYKLNKLKELVKNGESRRYDPSLWIDRFLLKFYTSLSKFNNFLLLRYLNQSYIFLTKNTFDAKFKNCFRQKSSCWIFFILQNVGKCFFTFSTKVQSLEILSTST